MTDSVRPSGHGGETWIEPDDRITYAEAQAITGRSHGYLRQRVQRGELTRMGGRRGDWRTTWLSRAECEAVALAIYRRPNRSGYWLTMAQAAESLGIARGSVYTARLRIHIAGNGDSLVRRVDLAALLGEPSAQEGPAAR